jgi:hypothetical protein
MSKKHYEQVARIIREAKDKNNESAQSAVDQVARELAIMFKMENANFKGVTFLNACGIWG